MALDILIQHTGFLKTIPSFDTLKKYLGDGYVGGVGPFYTFQKTPAAPDEHGSVLYMVYGKGDYIGRGFLLQTSHGEFCCKLSTLLPTTNHDLKTMGAVAEVLAGQLGGKVMDTVDGSPAPWPGLAAWYAKAQQANQQHLRALAATEGEAAVSGVRFPVYLPVSLRQRIGPVQDNASEMYFTAYLADMQANNYSCLLPSFKRSKTTGKPLGLYTLRNNTPAIFPKKPFIPLIPDLLGGEEVEQWWLILQNSHGGVMGRIPYEEFLAQLDEEDYTDFDEKHHLLRGFSSVRMQQLIQQPYAEIVFEDAPF